MSIKILTARPLFHDGMQLLFKKVHVDADIVVVDLDTRTMSDARTKYPDHLIVAYSQSPDKALPALRDGASAFLHKGSVEVAIKTIELVAIGGRGIVPSFILKPPIALPPPASPQFSKEEQRILKLIADGWTNAEISRRLVKAEATVKVHVKGILRKLRMTNRTQVAVWYKNQKFDQPTTRSNGELPNGGTEL
jgi:DNA-binding NarL/FixJ family response regulator